MRDDLICKTPGCVKSAEDYKKLLKGPQEPFLVQSIEAQTLMVCKGDAVIGSYDASTARHGCGIREGSFKTPPGIHRIKEKIGAGAPAGRIFKDRIDTGVGWETGTAGDNLILTRILRLEGLEEGINKGAGVEFL